MEDVQHSYQEPDRDAAQRDQGLLQEGDETLPTISGDECLDMLRLKPLAGKEFPVQTKDGPITVKGSDFPIICGPRALEQLQIVRNLALDDPRRELLITGLRLAVVAHLKLDIEEIDKLIESDTPK
jgi:hypothetical protein